MGRPKKNPDVNSAEQRKEIVVNKPNRLYRNSPVIGDGGYFPEGEGEEEQKNIIRNALIEATRYMWAPKVKTLEEAKERITEYFNHCIEDGQRPTVEGLALCLGTIRQTLHKWENGDLLEGKYNVSDIIRNSKEFIANYDANMVAKGKLNPVTYIFRAKNYYGMRDQQDYILTPNTEKEVSKDQLLEEASVLPDD